MEPLAPGSPAPSVSGVDFTGGPTALFFYKVTCPVCQLAAPRVETIERAYPGRISGIGQDPPDALDQFSGRYGMSFPSVSDAPPYPVSNEYGIRTVPTTFLVADDGTILRTVEAWDRQGLNDLSRELARLVGADHVPVSEPSDGLPPFRPG